MFDVFQKIATLVTIIFLVILGVIVVLQFRAIQTLRGNTVSLSNQLVNISAGIKSDFADWDTRLDTVQRGFGNLSSTTRQLQTSLDKRNQLDGKYQAGIAESNTRLEGLSDQLITVLNRANTNDSEFDAAIERFRIFGSKLEGRSAIEGSGILGQVE